MIHILLVADFRLGASGISLGRNMERLGYRVSCFDYRDVPLNLPGMYRLVGFRRAVRLLNQRLVNRNLLTRVIRERPRAVFLAKGETIRYSTLAKIKTMGVCLLNWYPDDPFNVLNSNPDVVRSIPLYDCYFIWGRGLIEPLRQAGAPRVEYLPFCFDPEFIRPIRATPEERRALGADLCFAGTWEPAREAWVDQLVDYDLAIWGNDWDRSAPSSAGHSHWRGPAAYGSDLSLRYTCSKIVLNFLRKQNRGANNMRTFEVPGAGAFLLTEWSQEQCELFQEDREIVCFRDIDELRDKTDYYLTHDIERQQIADAGHERAARDHTLSHRLERVAEVLSQLCDGAGPT